MRWIKIMSSERRALLDTSDRQWQQRVEKAVSAHSFSKLSNEKAMKGQRHQCSTSHVSFDAHAYPVTHIASTIGQKLLITTLKLELKLKLSWLLHHRSLVWSQHLSLKTSRSLGVSRAF